MAYVGSHRRHQTSLLSQAAAPRGAKRSTTTLLSVLALFGACDREGLSHRRTGMVRGLPAPRKSPLIAFLRFQRAGPLSACSASSGLFRPENALELLPSGCLAAWRSRYVSAAHPPLPFRDELRRHLRLRRLHPFRKLGSKAKGDETPTLLTFSPLRRSLSLPSNRLPGSSSPALDGTRT